MPSAGTAKKKAVGPADFLYGAQLGEGAYARVLHARMKPGMSRSPPDYAVKVMDKRFIRREGKTAFVVQERNILARAASPYVLRVAYSFQDAEHLYFVLELCRGGDLQALVRSFAGAGGGGGGTLVPLPAVRFLSGQLLLGLQYLHTVLHVVHRDIKPDNVLLDEKGHVRLADFGSAKDEGPSATSPEGAALAEAFVGTAEYVSPEVLRDESAHAPADLWALGCTLYVLCTGVPPFHGASEYLTFQQILGYDVEATLAYAVQAEAAVGEAGLSSPPSGLPPKAGGGALPPLSHAFGTGVCVIEAGSALPSPFEFGGLSPPALPTPQHVEEVGTQAGGLPRKKSGVYFEEGGEGGGGAREGGGRATRAGSLSAALASRPPRAILRFPTGFPVVVRATILALLHPRPEGRAGVRLASGEGSLPLSGPFWLDYEALAALPLWACGEGEEAFPWEALSDPQRCGSVPAPFLPPLVSLPDPTEEGVHGGALGEGGGGLDRTVDAETAADFASATPLVLGGTGVSGSLFASLLAPLFGAPKASLSSAGPGAAFEGSPSASVPSSGSFLTAFMREDHVPPALPPAPRREGVGRPISAENSGVGEGLSPPAAAGSWGSSSDGSTYWAAFLDSAGGEYAVRWGPVRKRKTYGGLLLSESARERELVLVRGGPAGPRLLYLHTPSRSLRAIIPLDDPGLDVVLRGPDGKGVALGASAGGGVGAGAAVLPLAATPKGGAAVPAMNAATRDPPGSSSRFGQFKRWLGLGGAPAPPLLSGRGAVGVREGSGSAPSAPPEAPYRPAVGSDGGGEGPDGLRATLRSFLLSKEGQSGTRGGGDSPRERRSFLQGPPSSTEGEGGATPAHGGGEVVVAPPSSRLIAPPLQRAASERFNPASGGPGTPSKSTLPPLSPTPPATPSTCIPVIPRTPVQGRSQSLDEGLLFTFRLTQPHAEGLGLRITAPPSSGCGEGELSPRTAGAGARRGSLLRLGTGSFCTPPVGVLEGSPFKTSPRSGKASGAVEGQLEETGQLADDVAAALDGVLASMQPAAETGRRNSAPVFASSTRGGEEEEGPRLPTPLPSVLSFACAADASPAPPSPLPAVVQREEAGLPVPPPGPYTRPSSAAPSAPVPTPPVRPAPPPPRSRNECVFDIHIHAPAPGTEGASGTGGGARTWYLYDPLGAAAAWSDAILAAHAEGLARTGRAVQGAAPG